MWFKKEKKQDEENLPKHVAFIMDGNGRWAKKRGLPRLFGHNAGTEALKRIVIESNEMGIGHITFYAFSTENWKRPHEEVDGLMKILVKFIRSEIEEIHSNNIKLSVFGDYEKLPDFAKQAVILALETTKDNSGMRFNIALNYGGRDEILNAVKLLVDDYSKNPQEINETYFSRFLYTGDTPDPDLLIRTSGEQRLSNFMLWQMAYTEFVFEPMFWPDFTPEHYREAIKKYQERQRRFGGL